MRYMGDTTPSGIPGLPSIPGIPNFFPQGGATPASGLPPIDAAAKAQLLAQASQMPDGYASELCDVCEATPYAKRWTLIRYGIGAGLGLLAGYMIFGRKRSK